MAEFGLPTNSKILKGLYYKDKTGSKNIKKVNAVNNDGRTILFL